MRTTPTPMPIAGLALLTITFVAATAVATTPRSSTPSPVPLPSPREQYAAARDKAIEQVLLSARGGAPFLRANAIEAIQPLPDRALPMAQLGLKDEHPAVRFASLVTIGKLRLTNLLTTVLRLREDPSPSVRAAAYYAARELDPSTDISPLADFLTSADPGVRSNAAMLLGLLGDSSAVPMMRELGQLPLGRRITAAQQSVYRVQLAEALVSLGHDEAMEGIRAGAYSSFDEVRILSVQAMGRLKDRRMEAALRAVLADSPIQLQVAAASALVAMGAPTNARETLTRAAAFDEDDVLDEARRMARQGGDAAAGAYVQQLIEDAEERRHVAANIRGQAAFALGQVDHAEVAQTLVGLLDDPSEHVRLSAAAAILRALAPAPDYRS